MQQEIITNLLNFDTVTLPELHQLTNSPVYQKAVELILDQVVKPRYNIGGSMPPGRAD